MNIDFVKQKYSQIIQIGFFCSVWKIIGVQRRRIETDAGEKRERWRERKRVYSAGENVVAARGGCAEWFGKEKTPGIRMDEQKSYLIHGKLG